VRMFQLLVTTDLSLRKHNQNRLRELVAAHPEIEVFAAHDPTAFARYATSTSADTSGSSQ
jgi:hypothetical protein